MYPEKSACETDIGGWAKLQYLYRSCQRPKRVCSMLLDMPVVLHTHETH